MTATIDDLEKELNDLLKHRDCNLDDLCGDLVEVKKHLIKSASIAVCSEYPLAEVENMGGNDVLDPINLSITLTKTIDVTRVERYEVKFMGVPLPSLPSLKGSFLRDPEINLLSQWL